MKIRSKTANVAEIYVEKIEGGVKTFWVVIKRRLTWGHFWSPPKKGNPRLGLELPFFFILNFK
ncbi:hypothetical protein E2C01_085626 [Portunus trituberculatus]|uniref:Uncharacterized protein n=1 Tax=Portunus trituberculatus TaxID=210409 RepID=A0A5B7J788_PORTR|nr:hypothetical protein [Portunus trituberculatus]